MFSADSASCATTTGYPWYSRISVSSSAIVGSSSMTKITSYCLEPQPCTGRYDQIRGKFPNRQDAQYKVHNDCHANCSRICPLLSPSGCRLRAARTEKSRFDEPALMVFGGGGWKAAVFGCHRHPRWSQLCVTLGRRS